MKPFWRARLDDCEAAVGRAAKRRQEAEDIIKIAEVVRRSAEDEENKLKADLLQLQSSASEKTGGSEDSIAQMNASLVRVLSETNGRFVESHAVAEAEKLLESLSVGLSRVAQLARHAAESQVKVENYVGTPKGTARGGRDTDGQRPNNLTGEDPGSLERHWSMSLRLQFRGSRTRTRGAFQHDVCQLGSEPSQNRMWKSKLGAGC